MKMCLQNNSLKTILRVATGVPLLTGIIIIIAVSVSLIELNATKWMVPVVKSLEKEETESLQRLAIAQAGFAEEIMEQMEETIERMRRESMSTIDRSRSEL